MLRYRPTEIRLTPEDVDGASRRLAARQPAANARNAVRPPPQLAGSGPRIRRGPERSRDESIVHQDADFSATSSSACTESVEESTSDEDGGYSPSLDASSLTELLRPLKVSYQSDADVSNSDLDLSDMSDLEPDTVLRVGPDRDDKEVNRQTSPSFGNHGFDFSGFGRPVPQYDGSSEAPRYSMPADVIRKNDSAVDVTEPGEARPQLSQRIGFGSSSPLDTDNRYPTAGSVDGVGSNNNNNDNNRPSSRTAPQYPSATSMPSLHSTAPHQHRRRTAFPTAIPSRRTSRHAPSHAPNHPWVRSGPSGSAAYTGEARRNTIAGSRQRRSQSTRFPSWQDEQENSGHAEREAMLVEAQRRRRFVMESAGGRLDRTPPGLGQYERRILDG
ncbi:hypothetical protein K490DRAFT_61431 [Saccharata proteae CBS 121410]|uniref:Uncharacterized protein n=1 Tax=Saccharata proteae CBS 121410 TaxID=1314787 RepID=A0A9P4I3V6_9PEZI|nr:hypothetical protein K490DRAFT_61431 [Saccharata proteae CBS 121410]